MSTNASKIMRSPCDPGPSDRAREWEASVGSVTLERECQKLRVRGLTDERPPRAPMTFEEQLAAVASGRARVVEVVPIRSPEPMFTLGGVGDWGGF